MSRNGRLTIFKLFFIAFFNSYSTQLIPFEHQYAFEAQSVMYQPPVLYSHGPQNVIVPLEGHTINLSQTSLLPLNTYFTLDLTKRWDCTLNNEGTGESLKTLLQQTNSALFFMGHRYGKTHPIYRHAANLHNPKNLEYLGFFLVQHNPFTTQVRAIPLTPEHNNALYQHLLFTNKSLDHLDRIQFVQKCAADFSTLYTVSIPAPLHTYTPASMSPCLSEHNHSSTAESSEKLEVNKVSLVEKDSSETSTSFHEPLKETVDLNTAEFECAPPVTSTYATIVKAPILSDDETHHSNHNVIIQSCDKASVCTPPAQSIPASLTHYPPTSQERVKTVPAHQNPHGFNVDFFSQPLDKDISSDKEMAEKNKETKKTKTSSQSKKKVSCATMGEGKKTATAQEDEDLKIIEKTIAGQQKEKHFIKEEYKRGKLSSHVYRVLYNLQKTFDTKGSIHDLLDTHMKDLLLLAHTLKDNKQFYQMYFRNSEHHEIFSHFLARIIIFTERLAPGIELSKDYRKYLCPKAREMLKQPDRDFDKFLDFHASTYNTQAMRDNLLYNAHSELYSASNSKILYGFLTLWGHSLTHDHLDQLVQIPLNDDGSYESRDNKEIIKKLIAKFTEEKRDIIEKETTRKYRDNPCPITALTLYYTCTPASSPLGADKSILQNSIWFLRSLKKEFLTKEQDLQELLQVLHTATYHLLHSDLFKTTTDILQELEVHLLRSINDVAPHSETILQNPHSTLFDEKIIRKCLNTLGSTKEGLQSISNTWHRFNVLCSEYLSHELSSLCISRAGQSFCKYLASSKDPVLQSTLYSLKLIEANEKSKRDIIKSIQSLLLTTFTVPKHAKFSYAYRNYYCLRLIHQLYCIKALSEQEWEERFKVVFNDIVHHEIRHHGSNVIEKIVHSPHEPFHLISIFLLGAIQKLSRSMPWLESYNEKYDLYYNNFITDSEYQNEKTHALQNHLKACCSNYVYAHHTNFIIMIHSLLDYIDKYESTVELPSSSKFKTQEEGIQNALKNIRFLFKYVCAELQTFCFLLHPTRVLKYGLTK